MGLHKDNSIQWVGPLYPSLGKCSHINIIFVVKQEQPGSTDRDIGTPDMVAYTPHRDIDTTDMVYMYLDGVYVYIIVHTFHVDTVIIFRHVTNIIMNNVGGLACILGLFCLFQNNQSISHVLFFLELRFVRGSRFI